MNCNVVKNLEARSVDVTFGLTCYNQKDYIVRALESIVTMEKPYSYEIIVGDDGSTDGSVAAMRAYARRVGCPLKVLVRSRDPNAEECIITRIEDNKLAIALAASGRYCLFGDGDDYWRDTSFVREAISRLNDDEELSAVVHRYIQKYSSGEELISPLLCSGKVNAWRFLAYGGYSHYGSVVFRNYFSKDDRALTMAKIDDTSVLYYLATKGQFYFVNQPVYVYQQYDGSGWYNLKKTLTNYEELCELCKVLRFYDDGMMPVLARQCRSVMFCLRHVVDVALDLKNGRRVNASYARPSTLEWEIAHWNELSLISRCCCYSKTAGLCLASMCARLSYKLADKFVRCSPLRRR